MPIYEYLCQPCNRIFSFLCKNPATAAPPRCPRCGSPRLRKMLSRFAVSRKGGGAAGNQAATEAAADPRVEGEMLKLMQEAESVDESDPRRLGSLMRRLSEVSGEPLDAGMEEAVRRLEAGEDPEKIEADIGAGLGDGGNAEGGGFGGSQPTRDGGLYSM